MRSVSGDLIPASFVRPLIAGVTIATVALTLYCLSNGISTVFMHLYYLPIILIAYFYHRRGIPVFTGLSLLYLVLATFFLYPSAIEIESAVLRTGMFILIGMVVAELSERLEKKKEDYRIAEEYQKSIIDNANVWLTILDTKGKILAWNRAAETVSGYSADEVLGQTDIWKRMYPDKDYRRKITGTITRIITEKNYLENFESEIRTKNGSTRTISWNTRGLVGAAGTVERYVAIGLNITERKRAEVALRESEEKFRAFFTTSQDCVFITSVDGCWIDFNNSAVELFGYQSREELMGIKIADLYAHPDERNMHLKLISEQGFSKEYPIDLKKKDGTIINALITSVARRDPKGTIIGFQGTIRDISELKRAEMELQELAAVVRHSGELIGIATFDGKINFLNDAGARMVGIQPADAMGKDFFRFIPDHLKKKLQEEVLPALMEQGMWSGDLQYINQKSGDMVDVHAMTFSITDPATGKPQYMANVSLDITDRKRVEEALRTSQIQLTEAMNLAHMAHWELDVPTGIFTFNDRFYALFGTTADREGGYQMPAEVYAREFVHPDDMQVVSDETNKAIAATDPDFTRQIEHRIIRRDGEVRHIIVRFGITKDAEGRTVKTHGANQDITERKLVENALARSEERYRTLAEASPDQIFIIGRDDTLQYINSTAQKLFRLSYDQVVGKPRKELFPPEIVKTQEASLKKVFETGEHIQSEEPIQFGTKELWIDTNLVPLKDEAGKVTSVLGIARDITERKRTEIIIRESEYKFHTIFDATGDGMLLTDIDTRRFVMANRAIQKLLGYTEVELLNLTISDIHPPADLPFVIGQFEKMVHGESDLIPEVPVLRKDGTVFYCDISSSVLVTIQDRHYMLGIFHDITDRKRAEDALRQVNKQLNLLSSITRHDILNQLMALKGYLYLSHEMIDKPTILSGYIQKEEQAANTIEAQIKFTRDYQELGITAPEWQNVNASIEKAFTGLPMRAVHVEVDPNNPEVFADRLFEKVFYNLIDNALRYGGADMKTIRVSSQEIDTGLHIVCEDDGVGLSAEDKKKLFTRGFGKNTGLGLFLSREILAITGITITENGIPGKGARFEITVPKGMWRMKGANE